jgi:hypothetical protein
MIERAALHTQPSVQSVSQSSTDIIINGFSIVTIQFYKMSNNLTPQYLSNLILQNFGMIHDHNTRHTSHIPPVHTRTSLYARNK